METEEVEDFLTRCGKAGVANERCKASAFFFLANLTKEPTGTVLSLELEEVERGSLKGRVTLALEAPEPEREEDRLSTFPENPFSTGLVCKNKR